MACNTFQCLTLFENSDDESFEVTPKGINYELHLSPFKMINDIEFDEWKEHYYSDIKKRFGGTMLMSNDATTFCFTNDANFKRVAIAFLFHIEVPLNNSICLIYEGSKILGRGSKNSELIREFSRFSEKQYNVTKNELLPNTIFW